LGVHRASHDFGQTQVLKVSVLFGALKQSLSQIQHEDLSRLGNLTKRGWVELNNGYQASCDNQQTTEMCLEQQPTKEGAKGYK